MAGADAAFKLLVSGLPGDITSDELNTVFGTYGRVTDVAIEGHGSAYVTYDSKKPADDAVQVLDNVYKIRQDAEHPIQVRWAPQNTGRENRRDGDAGWGGGGRGDDRSAGKDGETDFKLFVGNLPSDINEEELHTVFGTYGEVPKVVLLKPNMTGSRAALVFYGTKQSGDDAIKVLDQQYKIRHDATQAITVKWAREKNDRNNEKKVNKVFAGNLPSDLTEDELKTVFETYGKLEKCILLPAKSEKNGMRAAIILYEERDSAETAIKLLNDVYKFRTDSEEPIQVKWGRDKDDGGGKGASGGGWGGGGGWGSGGGGSWDRGDQGGWGGGGGGWRDDHRGGGGQSWGSGGGGGGGWRDDRGGDSRGGWGGGGGGGRGGWDGGRDRRDSGGSSGWGGGGGGGGYDKDRGGKGGKNNPPSGKLYIANLPEDITEEAIQFVFKTYGQVKRVHIMNGKVVNGCVSAFVDYDSSNEAETAIATLNEKYEIRPGFGPIAVRHANAPRSRPY